MGLDKNMTDGAAAMDDEERRQLEETLLRAMPSLKYNTVALREAVDAVLRGAASGSDAVDSKGRIQNSDLGDEGFFQNMEAYRQSVENPNIFNPGESRDPEANDAEPRAVATEPQFASPQDQRSTVRNYPAPGRGQWLRRQR
jgi:hypothetical protein